MGILIARLGCPECGYTPDQYREVPQPGETREYDCSECRETFEIENRSPYSPQD